MVANKEKVSHGKRCPIYFSPLGMEFLIKEQLHPKSLKKILRQTGCAPLPTPLVLTLQSKMVVNNYTKNYQNANDHKNLTLGFDIRHYENDKRKAKFHSYILNYREEGCLDICLSSIWRQ